MNKQKTTLPQPIGDEGYCLVGGQILDPDNPALLIDCPSDGDRCDDCPHYIKQEYTGFLSV